MDERIERISVDAATAEALRDALHEVDICGPDGEVLGRYRSGKLIDLYSTLKPPQSWEELQRRAREEGGCTTEELLARLEAEPCPSK